VEIDPKMTREETSFIVLVILINDGHIEYLIQWREQHGSYQSE
jgi:hypothetical protein